MIWGGVVSEFFSIFLQVCSHTIVLVRAGKLARRLTLSRHGVQAILPTDRTKRLTFLEGLRERGLIE